MPTTANTVEPRLTPQQWAKFKKDMLITGTYNPDMWDRMSHYQREWTQDTLNTIKSFKNE